MILKNISLTIWKLSIGKLINHPIIMIIYHTIKINGDHIDLKNAFFN